MSCRWAGKFGKFVEHMRPNNLENVSRFRATHNAKPELMMVMMMMMLLWRDTITDEQILPLLGRFLEGYRNCAKDVAQMPNRTETELGNFSGNLVFKTNDMKVPACKSQQTINLNKESAMASPVN